MKQVKPIDIRKDLKNFIDFPHELYRNDPNYVPELYVAQRDLLTPGKHPFHEHSEVQLFLAYDGKSITGRIAAILNRNHNEFNKTSDGFFGFFDCIDDQETADLLIAAATDWVKSRGVNTLIGPANFSTNETVGLLVDGFELPPVAMMPYNAKYYLRLLENAGLEKRTDLLAYYVEYSSHNDRSVRMLNTLGERLKRNNIVIRKINMKNFKEEAEKLREVYNTAWDKNAGFVPMTEHEFNHMAKDLKMVLNPDFCLIAEQEGKFIGFALGIPDINQILIKIKRGRLLPFGIIKLLTGMKKISQIRVLCLGVVEGYRKLGIEACLYGHIIKNASGSTIKGAECSWMLEENYLMNHAIEQINGRLYKRYRILQKPV